MPKLVRTDSLDSGRFVRDASHVTDPFVRSASIDGSASNPSGAWKQPPTRIPIPGQKLTPAQKKNLARRAKKQREREGKELPPPVPKVVAQPKQEPKKQAPTDRFERCRPGHPDWAMKPLKDVEPVVPNFDISFGEFDFEVVKADPDIELWIVRTPSNVTSKLLGQLKLWPLEEASARGGHAGHDTSNKNTFDMWLTDLSRPRQELLNDPNLKGEEMLDMEILLPSQKAGGKLFMAPRPVARTLTITAVPLPKKVEPKPEDAPVVWKNEPRENYPVEMLKYRFPFEAQRRVPKPELQPSSSHAPVASGSRAPQVKKRMAKKKANALAAAERAGMKKNKRNKKVKFQDAVPEPEEGAERPTKRRKTASDH